MEEKEQRKKKKIHVPECFAAITDELESAINNVLGGPDPVVIPAEGTAPAVSITAQNIDELCAFLDNPISLNRAQINAVLMHSQ